MDANRINAVPPGFAVSVRLLIRLSLAVSTLFVASGCATIMRDGEQKVDIMVHNLDGRAIGAKCRVENTSGAVIGNAPMMQVSIDRSASDLVIECVPFNKSLQVARATAVSRSVTTFAVVIQPVAASVMDAMSGRMFDYPTKLILVSGKARTFDLSSNKPGPIGEKAIGLSNVADITDRSLANIH
ncbi:hypothetical protein BH10PSE17_BH10PSE17_17970 [soil metagenome]